MTPSDPLALPHDSVMALLLGSASVAALCTCLCNTFTAGSRICLNIVRHVRGSLSSMATPPKAYLSWTPLRITPAPRHELSAVTRERIEVQCAVKKTSLRNIVCSKTLKVKEDRQEEAAKLCKGIAELAHQEMQDRSNGILAFEVFQDRFDEKHIHFWERYVDNTRMGRFNTCKEFQDFMNNIQECLEEPVGLALYDWKNGQLGPLAVQGGPKGEGGLDDATGAGGRGGASYAQTSDVVNVSDVKRGEEGDSFGMDEKKKGFFSLPKFKLPWES